MEREQDQHDDVLVDLGAATSETKGDNGMNDDFPSTRQNAGILAA